MSEHHVPPVLFSTQPAAPRENAAALEALAALDSLPDAAMALLVWWRDEHGGLVRPCTREEIRAGLLSGSVAPDAVLGMAPIAQQARDSAAGSEALRRRRTMRAV